MDAKDIRDLQRRARQARRALAQLPDLQSDFTPELACVAAQVFDFA
jgi:hypothetical protein